jgi:hypothetical protein
MLSLVPASYPLRFMPFFFLHAISVTLHPIFPLFRHCHHRFELKFQQTVSLSMHAVYALPSSAHTLPRYVWCVTYVTILRISLLVLG